MPQYCSGARLAFSLHVPLNRKAGVWTHVSCTSTFRISLSFAAPFRFQDFLRSL